MQEQLIEETLDYLELIPTNSAYQNMENEDRFKYIFASSELIADRYPQIVQSRRMLALQTLYTVEAEDEGFGMLKRHDITSYEVKDVKAALDKGSMLSPDVQAMIDAQLEELEPSKTRGAYCGGLI